MQRRAATPADASEIAALNAAWEAQWYGAAETDEAELREGFDRVDPLDSHSRVVVADGRIVAAAWWWQRSQVALIVDPSADVHAVYNDLIPWSQASGATGIEALADDRELQAALTRHGWEYERSQVEMIRAATRPAAVVRAPASVSVQTLALAPAEVYQLIYDDAGWADVLGHADRNFVEWQSIFFAQNRALELQLVALEGATPVGVALTRIFADGTGWISQLAVIRAARRKGVARALLSEACRRLMAAGASQIGLGVSAVNAGALGLYEDMGFSIDRNWLIFRPSEPAR